MSPGGKAVPGWEPLIYNRDIGLVQQYQYYTDICTVFINCRITVKSNIFGFKHFTNTNCTPGIDFSEVLNLTNINHFAWLTPNLLNQKTVVVGQGVCFINVLLRWHLCSQLGSILRSYLVISYKIMNIWFRHHVSELFHNLSIQQLFTECLLCAGTVLGSADKGKVVNKVETKIPVIAKLMY